MFLTRVEKMIDAWFSIIPRFKPNKELAQHARLIAHRGAHDNNQGIIENTLVAFRRAKASGCWGIELDVRATADNVLVVNHDRTLNRLWNHDVAIASLTFAQLRTLVPGVPTLAEVVDEFGHQMHLFIELKDPFQDEDVLINVLRDLSAGREYHLLTLSAPIFQSLSQVPKHALLLVASYNNTREFCDLSLCENYGGVLGHYLLLTNKLVNQLKTSGQQIGVGFIDSKYSLYRELNRGVAWFFTNQVTEVSRHL